MNQSAVSGVLLLALLCLGCGAKPTDIAPVEGTVTMDGKPLPYASVLFITGTGRPAGGRTDEQGHYVLTYTEGRHGAMLGKNMVRISTVRDPGETAEGKRIPGSGETVPMMYNAMTELVFVVEPGKTNVADFVLDSSGPLPQDLEDQQMGTPVEDAPAVPEGPDAPETDAPETDSPETDSPETDSPETDSPETDAPETDAPETDAPETDAPEADAPEADAPEADAPEADAPEADALEADAPEADAPEAEASEADIQSPASAAK